MEIVESVKQIRANQNILLGVLNKKGTKKDEKKALNTERATNAVEALKRKIDNMQDYLSAMKNMEVYRKKYQPRQKTSETDYSEEIVREAFARIYQIEKPTQEIELRVKNSMGLGVAKSLGKPGSGTPNFATEQYFESCTEAENNNKVVCSSKNQAGEGVVQTCEVESKIKNQALANKYSTEESTNNLSVEKNQKEALVLIKQPSWKKLQNSNRSKNNETTPNQNKQQTMNIQTNNEPNQNQTSPGEISNSTIINQPRSRNIRIQETKTLEDGGKRLDEWTVESLKSRINFMKIKNTLDGPSLNKAQDITITKNGGEAKQKISQVALRSFHKEAGAKNSRKLQFISAVKVRLGYQRTAGRRNFSTFRPSKLEQPMKPAFVCYRRSIFNTPQNMSKRDWVRRIRRCFVLKKIKGSKCENWKNSPREIPYAKKEVHCKSPTPILWKSKDLGDNHQESNTSNPPRIMLGEKVNPAVLNAEQRILASLSRLITIKPPPEASQDPTTDIEKKIRRAKNKVNLMPWLKRSKSTDAIQKLPQTRGLHNKLANEEQHESGYEWILKNRDMVEELKRQSQFAAGKPLVPAEVKHSINQYKLPLKAEIAQYRRKIEQKCSGNFCMYYTPKRWYSTCFPGRNGGILCCSDIILDKKRGIKTVEPHKKNALPSKCTDRKTRSDVVLRPNLKLHHQEMPNNISDIDTTSENPGEEKRLKKWTWKVPNKTRAFAPKSTTLTSPSKVVGPRMSEMSPCALKKQVEELKRLIKKAREEVTEKINESPIETQPADKYEARLKRLVRAAHNNAQKMQIAEPKYTSENNMMTKKSSNTKKDAVKPKLESSAKSDDSKYDPEASLLKTLFKQKNEDPKTLSEEILQRNNLSSLPALASNKKAEKTINKVYLKLKLLVEAVRKKSAVLDPPNEVRLLPSSSIKGSIGLNLMHHSLPIIMKNKDKPAHTVESKNAIKEPTSAVNVALKAEKIPAPSNTVQLWKGESKPKEFNFQQEQEPTYGDLLMLFTKAKELFYYQLPEEHKTTDAKLEKTAISNDHKMRVENMPSYEEMTNNWLSVGEDVSKTAKVVSVPKNDSSKDGENISQAGSSSQADVQMNSGVSTLDYTITKSKIIPLEMDNKVCCDGGGSAAATKLQEDEGIHKNPRSQTDSADQLANQVKTDNSMISPHTNQNHSRNVVCQTVTYTKLLQPDIESNEQESQASKSLESTNPLFQKPLAAWESLTKSFGNGVGKGLFGNTTDIPSNTRQEPTAVNDATHQQGNIGGLRAFQGEISHLSTLKMGHFHDISKQFQNTSVADKTSNCHHVECYTQELIKDENTISDSTENGANESNDQYIKDCADSMKALEENVKKYESYYRDYFTKDIVSGYDHLHQVYDGLSKLSDVVQHRMDNPLKLEIEARKEAFTSVTPNTLEKVKAPAERNMVELKTQEPDGSNLDEQPLNMEIKQAETIDHHGIKAIGTSGTQPSNAPRSSSEVSKIGVSSNSKLSITGQEPDASAHPSMTGQQPIQNNHSGGEVAKPVTEKQFLNSSGNRKEGIQIQETEVSHSNKKRILTNVERYPSDGSRDNLSELNGGNNSKGKSTNYEELLTQDPTLNPEVVKNLKLPVILSEDCHTEKNWFTKFYSGPYRNR